MMAGLTFWHVAAVAAGGGVLWWWWASQRLEVGAWTGYYAITHVGETIARARSLGVDRLCVFVNSNPEAGAAFTHYNRALVLGACAAFKAAGFKLTIVSWMTPAPDWIAGAKAIGQLATDAGADEMEFDLEEDWTALARESDATIASTTRALFSAARSAFSGAVGVDCIVYTDLRVLGPAVAASDFVVPQAYATKRNAAGLAPGQLERIAFKRFATFGKPIVMGVAGWNQADAYGYTLAHDAMRASLDAIRGLALKRVRVWRLESLDAAEGAELLAWKRRADAPDIRAVS